MLMPALSAAQLTRIIEDAFVDANASAVLISKQSENPHRFYVIAGDSSFPVWIYIWTLTHGGGLRSPDEYRIQLTSVNSPLPQNPDGPTVLLGYEPGLRCFAGFDLRKHYSFTPGSSSIQISFHALREALRDGFAFIRKGNDEIAVGFRPDNILAYCLNAESLHENGADALVTDLLIKAGKFEPISSEETESLSMERRKIVSTVSRLARDSDFRRKVSVAYDRKCCVTGLQLRLIDAAHIIPVGAQGSTDEVTNGICLSPTYHRAYDRGLIYLSEQMKMLINDEMKTDLIGLMLGGGLSEFEAHLGREIFLPPDRKQWPAISNVRAAINLRQEQQR